MRVAEFLAFLLLEKLQEGFGDCVQDHTLSYKKLKETLFANDVFAMRHVDTVLELIKLHKPQNVLTNACFMIDGARAVLIGLNKRDGKVGYSDDEFNQVMSCWLGNGGNDRAPCAEIAWLLDESKLPVRIGDGEYFSLETQSESYRFFQSNANLMDLFLSALEVLRGSLIEWRETEKERWPRGKRPPKAFLPGFVLAAIIGITGSTEQTGSHYEFLQGLETKSSPDLINDTVQPLIGFLKGLKTNDWLKTLTANKPLYYILDDLDQYFYDNWRQVQEWNNEKIKAEKTGTRRTRILPSEIGILEKAIRVPYELFVWSALGKVEWVEKRKMKNLLWLSKSLNKGTNFYKASVAAYHVVKFAIENVPSWSEKNDDKALQEKKYIAYPSNKEVNVEEKITAGPTLVHQTLKNPTTELEKKVKELEAENRRGHRVRIAKIGGFWS